MPDKDKISELVEWLHTYRSATLVAKTADDVQELTKEGAIKLNDYITQLLLEESESWMKMIAVNNLSPLSPRLVIDYIKLDSTTVMKFYENRKQDIKAALKEQEGTKQ